MAISNPVTRKDVVFIQRDNINSAYGEIHASGSLLIPYLDADGNITVSDSASFYSTFPTTGGGGPSVSASFATRTISASHAIRSDFSDTASYFSGTSESSSFSSRTISGSHAIRSDFSDTASFVASANSATSASFSSRTISGSHSLRSNLADTASFVSTVNTASYANFGLSSSFALTAGLSDTASYVASVDSASFSTRTISGSHALRSNQADTASYVSTVNTASYSNFGLSSSFALTSHLSDTASYVGAVDSASFATRTISGSHALRSNQSDTASFVTTVNTASYSNFATSASHAGFSTSGSYSDFAKSSSFSNTSSWAISASWAPGGTGTSESSSWASASLSSSWADFARSASQAISASILIADQTSVEPIGDTVRVIAGGVPSFIFGTAGSSYNLSQLPFSTSIITASRITGGDVTRGWIDLAFANLVNAAGSPVVDWDSYTLRRSTNNITVNWEDWQLLAGGVATVNWNNRTLNDAAEVVVVAWGNTDNELIVYGNVSASVVTASLLGTASWATSASWAPAVPSTVAISSSWASASLSSSWADFARSASWAPSTPSSVAVSASWASASLSSSWSDFARSASWAPSFPSTVAISASWASASLSSSFSDFALSASWAPSAPSSVAVSASWASASLSSSWADFSRTSSWTERSVSSSYTPTGRSVVLSSAYTPAISGADSGEITVPFSPLDGVTPVVWPIKRLVFRVQLSGSTSSSLTVQRSSGVGIFNPVTVGSVTLPASTYEAYNTGTLGSVASNDKLRFNVDTIGTAQNWNVIVELSNSPSTASIGGSFNITRIVNDYTASVSDMTLICRNTSSINIMLPTASLSGMTINIKQANSGSVTVSGNDPIDNQTSVTVGSIYSSMTVQSDGLQWWIV